METEDDTALLVSTVPEENLQTPPGQRFFFISSIIVLVFNILWQGFYVLGLINAILLAKDALPFISAVIFNTIAVLLLANGLFGRRFRGFSLQIYVIIFEFLPIWFFTLVVICLSAGYNYFIHALEEAAEWLEESIDAKKILIVLISFSGAMALFHTFAAYVVMQYRKFILPQMYFLDF